MDEALERALEQYLDHVLRSRQADAERFLADHPALNESQRRRIRSVGESLAVKAHSASFRGGAADAPRDFGRYSLLRELGHGGQGVVFLAQDRQLSRRVALKVLRACEPRLFAHTPSPEAHARLKREAEVAARLDHPGICAVYETAKQDGLAYIAMRYVEGETLARKISAAREAGVGCIDLERETRGSETPKPRAGRQRNRASRGRRQSALQACVHLIEQVARALHHAHVAGVVHRDIKPANIMVGPGAAPVILDFGLARDPSTTTWTGSGALLGSPAYMSPEQIAPSGIRPDSRADVYSLGIVLYECLTLRRPFECEARESLYYAILSTPAPDPRRYNDAIGRELAGVVAKAIEKVPGRRYASALDFAEDLRRLRSGEPVLAQPVGPLLRGARWLERNTWKAAALAAGGAAALILTVGLHRGRDVHGLTETDPAEARNEFAAAGQNERALALIARCDQVAAELERLPIGHGTRGEYRAKVQLLDDLALDALVAIHQGCQLLPTTSAARGLLMQAYRLRGLALRARWPEHAPDDAALAAAVARGSGLLHLLGSPSGTSAHIFAYREFVDRAPGLAELGARRLVPVPYARDGAAAWAGALDGVPEPGEEVVCITRVEPGSAGDRAGLRAGDLVTRLAGSPAASSLFVLPGTADNALGATPAFARLTALNGVALHESYDLERTLGSVTDGAPCAAELWCAGSSLHLGLWREGVGLSMPIGEASDALSGELPPEGLVLTAVRDGRPREFVLTGSGRSGIEALRTANPLVCSPANSMGCLPLDAALELPQGSYLLVLGCVGYEAQRLPVIVRAGQAISVRAELLPEGTTPLGFVYVPPGPLVLGEYLRSCLDGASEAWLDGYWISRAELCSGDYREFLNDAATGPQVERGMRDGTWRRVPRESLDPGLDPPPAKPLWPLAADGSFSSTWAADVAIHAITGEDAEAYCVWRTQSGIERGDEWFYRLPTEEEWERAARGAGDREYPWGDVPETAFCNTFGARSGASTWSWEPVLRFPRDESPFGVRGMGGSAIEWCLGRSAEDMTLGGWRGGCATSVAPSMCSSVHSPGSPTRPGENDGVRLVAWKQIRRAVPLEPAAVNR